jgi:hypothetical protein
VLKLWKKRWQMVTGVVVVLVFFTAALSWKHPPPQIITLPSGEQYEFITAEWGTNDVQPTFAARTVALLPIPIRNFVLRKWGQKLGIVTLFSPGPGPAIFGSSYLIPPPPPQPTLRFWFRSINNNHFDSTNDFKFILADRNGVVSGQGNGGWASYGQGMDKWLTFGFPVLPRRSDTLQLLLFHADSFSGPFQPIATLQFPNPHFGHFPDWKPEAVPATKMAGDLRVTLSDFSVGTENRWNDAISINGKQTHLHSPGLGEDRKVVFKLEIGSPRGTNEVWLIGRADLSDATGNHIHTWPLASWPTYEYCFGPALWPDESAWRLELYLKKSRGYNPEEVITFTNVPLPFVGNTERVFQTNLINGVPIVLKLEFTRRPDHIPVVLRGEDLATHATLELLNHPKDFAMDFVEINADTGWNPKELSFWHTTNSETVYLFSVPANVHTLNFTWAVQQQRRVEFMVKPPAMK